MMSYLWFKYLFKANACVLESVEGLYYIYYPYIFMFAKYTIKTLNQCSQLVKCMLLNFQYSTFLNIWFLVLRMEVINVQRSIKLDSLEIICCVKIILHKSKIIIAKNTDQGFNY